MAEYFQESSCTLPSKLWQNLFAMVVTAAILLYVIAINLPQGFAHEQSDKLCLSYIKSTNYIYHTSNAMT